MCLRTLAERAVPAPARLIVTSHIVRMGGSLRAAARYSEVVVAPGLEGACVAQDVAEALAFRAGRPVNPVLPAIPEAPRDHSVIVWDGSRVAARALGDARRCCPQGAGDGADGAGRKADRIGLASRLAASLQRRGYAAEPVDLVLSGHTLAVPLQDTAIDRGRNCWRWRLWYSRLRDFVPGGAMQASSPGCVSRRC